MPEELFNFYEKVIDNIAHICPEQEALDFVNLLQQIRSIIILHEGKIDIEQEITLRKAAEQIITGWLCWYCLPESILATAVELVQPEH